jgi:hypothetical protein
MSYRWFAIALFFVLIAAVAFSFLRPPRAPTPRPASEPIFERVSYDASTTSNQNNPLQAQQSSADRNVSELDVAVDANVTFLITNIANRSTGYDSNTGEQLQDIPDSTYLRDRIGNEIDSSAQINRPSQGEYSIVLTGIRNGPYALSVRAFSSDGSAQAPLSHKGEITVGAKVKFLLVFTPKPGTSSTLSEIPVNDSGLPFQSR